VQAQRVAPEGLVTKGVESKYLPSAGQCLLRARVDQRFDR
jgi:hypothetical protein